LFELITAPPHGLIHPLPLGKRARVIELIAQDQQVIGGIPQ
jgi:hypothetical protein